MLAKAINRIFNEKYGRNANFVIIDNEFKWLDEKPKPLEDEINKKIIELKVEEKKKELEEVEAKLIQKVLKEYDYDDRGDVAIWAQKGILETNPFYKEAVAIQKWIKEMDIKMYKLQDRINVKNIDNIDVNKLAKEFPEFKGIQ